MAKADTNKARPLTARERGTICAALWLWRVKEGDADMELALAHYAIDEGALSDQDIHALIVEIECANLVSVWPPKVETP